mmetsp:Transcript_10049/g.28431  ORF Transcript_10049/g.28431 Transcript_10049/m.28431 type:complete len:225 (-) Transcript_10049:147-821(-)
MQPASKTTACCPCCAGRWRRSLFSSTHPLRSSRARTSILSSALREPQMSTQRFPATLEWTTKFQTCSRTLATTRCFRGSNSRASSPECSVRSKSAAASSSAPLSARWRTRTGAFPPAMLSTSPGSTSAARPRGKISYLRKRDVRSAHFSSPATLPTFRLLGRTLSFLTFPLQCCTFPRSRPTCSLTLQAGWCSSTRTFFASLLTEGLTLRDRDFLPVTSLQRFN